MKSESPSKRLTPLNPPLTRGRQELSASTVRLESETIKQSNTAPLTGGRQELSASTVRLGSETIKQSNTAPLTGGRQELSASTVRLGSETIKQSNTAPPLSERGSQLSCGVPTGVLLAGARGGREGFAFVAYNKKLTTLARENRKNPTAAESKLWTQLLRMNNLSGYKFSRQKPIANYIADFYCAALHLVIEIDGDSHAESVEYDAERTKILVALGITVIRYTNEEILKNLPGVYDDLMRKIASINEEIVKQ